MKHIQAKYVYLSGFFNVSNENALIPQSKPIFGIIHIKH